jgi:hypothetical protein
MTAPIADLDSGFPVRSLLENMVLYRVTIPITTAGATDTLLDAPNGVTATLGATGVYAIAGLPPCPSATTSRSKASFMFQLQSAAATVTEVTISTAHSTSAGTISITCSKAGTAATPASGDKIYMWILMERE